MWSKFFKSHWQECKLKEPASEAAIERCEDELNLMFPQTLRTLLRESNGIIGPNGEYLIFSVEEILDCNEDLWLNGDYEGIYMPFVSMLFFGADEVDNLFAYPILGDRPDKSKIFKWRRDTDSRMYYADGLEQYFYMQWKCFEQSNPLLWDQSAVCKDFADYRSFLGNIDEQESFAPDDSSSNSMRG